MALQVVSDALGDITSGVGPDLKITNKAARRTAVLDFTYQHPTNDLPPESGIQVFDGSTRVFRGKVRNRRRADTGPGPQRRRVFVITCQDARTFLDDDVVDGTLVLASGQSDQAMIQSLIATYCTTGITAPGATCQVVQASMPEVDVSHLSLTDAIAAIQAISGAKGYVDDDLYLHNYTTESATAPFALVDYNANGSTRVGITGLVLPDDTVELRNAVWVVGGEGTTPEWRPPTGSWPTASQTAYGRREYVLRLPSVTDQGTLQALGDAFLAQHDTPMSPVTCRLYQPGLKAGMIATLDSDLWGVNVSLPVVSVETTIAPGTKATLVYDVTLGDVAPDLGTVIADIQASLGAVPGVVQDVAGVDTTPPGQVTGLTLDTGLVEAGDGSFLPYLDAEWTASGASDLAAYDLEVDAANQGRPTVAASASGTGGSLGAGTYTVVVTGLGTVAGETVGDPQQVTVAAGQRLYVNVTALEGCAQYRVYAERDTNAPHLALTTGTTGSDVEVTTEGTAGATPPSESDAVDFARPYTVRTTLIRARITPVAGGTWHQARVKAEDRAGNLSASWSALAALKSSADANAPNIPVGLTAVPGYRLLGLTWNRNGEADLDRYQVRFYQGSTPPSDPLDWTRIDTKSTVLVVTGLTADVPYIVQARAIDRSGNVRTSAADPTAVFAPDNLDAGWSNTDPGDYVVATPTLVGAADLAVNSVVTTLLNAGTISADYISGGQLTVGGLAGATTQVAVYDSLGRLAGTWSDTGLVVYDVANSDRRIRLDGATLQFSTDGGATWSTAIDADGITASAVLLGSLAGGPNAIQNAGYELTDWQTPYTKAWTATADWSADIPTAGTYRVNVDRSTGDLKLSAYA